MEPKFEAPRDLPRQTPEIAPDQSIDGQTGFPEQQAERGYEAIRPSFAETVPSGVSAPVVDAQSLSVPSPAPTFQAPSDTALTSDDDIPLVANDDDLIEKEWVDKAKQIIAETRDDPYRREQEISKLQVEYIRRRYGREIGGPSEV